MYFDQGHLSSFFQVPTLIDLIIGFLVLIIKSFDNYKTFTHKSDHITTTSSEPFLLPTSCHRSLLVFPVCVVIIGEDSFVIESQVSNIVLIDTFNVIFQGLVHNIFLESLMFSSWKEDSLYPVSRCRATIEVGSLSTMSGLSSNLANRHIASSSGGVGAPRYFFPQFFVSFFC